MAYLIRGLRRDDEPAVSHICWKTYGDGTDERYRTLAGLRWAVPYVRFETDHGFVAVGEDDVPVGYILCAPNARQFRRNFRRRMKDEIISELDSKKQEFEAAEYRRRRRRMTRYLEVFPSRLERDYPAHLHIDILDEHQRKGLGHQLVDALVDHLGTLQCPGVHLGVGIGNEKGIAFYRKYGFEELSKRPRLGVVYFGLKI